MPVTIGGGLSFCGAELSAEQFQPDPQNTRDCQGLALTELAFTVCELLEWKRPNGNPKSRECYLFLLSLQERGWLPWLPAPKPHARGPHQTRVAAESDPQSAQSGVLGDWLPLQIELVETAAGRKLIEQYIHRYHYLLSRPLRRTVALPGARRKGATSGIGLAEDHQRRPANGAA